MTMLTQDILKHHMYYDPLSGLFTWRIEPNYRTIKPGQALGYLDKDGYRIIGLLRKRYKVHRLAFLYMTGFFPEDKVDHRDGVTDNNVWTNLREATNSGNQQNKKKKIGASSKYFGVFHNIDYRGAKKYNAYITINGVQRLIGRYLTEIEAHEAYCKAKKITHEFQPVLRDNCKIALYLGE